MRLVPAAVKCARGAFSRAAPARRCRAWPVHAADSDLTVAACDVSYGSRVVGGVAAASSRLTGVRV